VLNLIWLTPLHTIAAGCGCKNSLLLADRSDQQCERKFGAPRAARVSLPIGVVLAAAEASCFSGKQRSAERSPPAPRPHAHRRQPPLRETVRVAVRSRRRPPVEVTRADPRRAASPPARRRRDRGSAHYRPSAPPTRCSSRGCSCASANNRSPPARTGDAKPTDQRRKSHTRDSHAAAAQAGAIPASVPPGACRLLLELRQGAPSDTHFRGDEGSTVRVRQTAPQKPPKPRLDKAAPAMDPRDLCRVDSAV
jgi:hypothetical protein